MKAYDVAKLSGHQAVCEELQRHSIHVIKTDITKVSSCAIVIGCDCIWAVNCSHPFLSGYMAS